MDDLAARIAAHQWYHSLELAPGVLTPGWFDLRTVPGRLPMPERLDGMRCLDVGTFDGFWAFEMERRGAAEVVALDVLDPMGWDWPAGAQAPTREELARRRAGGEGFRLAAERLGSRVSLRERSVYALDPEADGRFDFVYMGSVLLHLRDPVGALARVRSVARGQVLSVDAYDLPLTLRSPRRPAAYLDAVGRPWWWRPNAAAIPRMLTAAGLRPRRTRRVLLPPGSGHSRPLRRPLSLLGSREARSLAFASLFGAPHLAVLSD